MRISDNTTNLINSGGKRIREKKVIGFFLLLPIVLLFFSTVGFQDKLIQGWYQQWLPDLNGSTIKDITFLDSLTGFAVTNINSAYQGYILKTTNGGDNWTIKLTYNPPYTNVSFIKISFIDDSTGFACSDYIHLFKTTNRGDNWSAITTYLYPEDIAFMNIDTMIAVKSGGLNGGVYRTTNGGGNWQLIWTNGSSGNPNKIYMYNKYLGFHCDYNTSFYTRRTTDGGLSWTNINEESFMGINFYDSLIGWKGRADSIKKTTNGGLNWFNQDPPQVVLFRCYNILPINKDTLWFVGCQKYWDNGVICKTTNGGLNWGYQIPDSSINIYNYYYASKVNSKNIWAYIGSGLNTGVHTKVGGNDTTYYTAINNHAITVPDDYTLYQNYPNPFNQSTIIKYRLSKRAEVKITIYDITGKEIKTLLNEIKQSGLYDVRFEAGNLPSGIYFYRISIDNEQISTKKMILIK